MTRSRSILLAVIVYLVAFAGLQAAERAGIARETVQIPGPSGKPCLGTIWRPPHPKGVILVGHGITSNQSIMALAAQTFCRNGYLAVSFDFWGHGRSRERFDERQNAAQVLAWRDWAREQFKPLPVAYLGHSMGGYSASECLRKPEDIDAFVLLGALPHDLPACKTLVAAGRFEELFSQEEADRAALGRAELATSPFSNHALEPWDPVLLGRVIAWLDRTLGLEPRPGFPWNRGLLTLIGTFFGGAAALAIAEQAARLTRRPVRPPSPALASRRWSLNPYRLTGRILGITGMGTPPRAGTFLTSIVSGIVFSLSFIVLLSWLIDGQVFTCSLTHAGRCYTWILLIPFMTAMTLGSAWALERVALAGPRSRFWVAALTRCVPLLILSVAFRPWPGWAFGGMILGILALVLAVLALIYTKATRATEDFRAGAIASGITLAWVAAFWFPLVWGP